MAGWDSQDGTSVSATERLRAAWAVRLRPAAAAKPKPKHDKQNDHGHKPPERPLERAS